MSQSRPIPQNTTLPGTSSARDPLFDVVQALIMLFGVWGHFSRRGVLVGPLESFPLMGNLKIGVSIRIFRFDTAKTVLKVFIVFFALEFVTFPFVAKALGILVPGYRHFLVAERTDLWQSLVAVAAQLAVLTAPAPLVTGTLSRLQQWLFIGRSSSDPTSGILSQEENT